MVAHATCSPLIAAFRRYLATRIDILPETLCAELAVIPDEAPPSDPDTVREIFVRDLGRAAEWVFAWFDPVPFASRLFSQSHHARVGDIDVVVKVAHPRNAHLDLDDLQPPAGVSPAAFESALADFRALLPALTTFSDDIRAAALLAHDAHVFDGLAAPRLWPHLCSPNIAVYERCRGLADPLAPDPDLCRAVCLAWLRQALHGAAFPVDPSPANIGLSRDGRVIFHSGPYAVLEEPARSELLRYLIAVAGDNVDEAADRLQAAIGLGAHGDGAALRRDIRQMAPFRDGFRGLQPVPRPSDASFSEEVLIHWRIAAQCGCGDRLTSFYRGFFTLSSVAHALLPDRDLMAEALRDLRLIGAFHDIQELVRPSEAPAMMEGLAMMMMRMPEDMDRVLTAFASGNFPVARPAGRRPVEDRSSGLLCVAVVLGAAAMAAYRLVPAAQFLAAGMFFAAGCLVLWALARRG